MASCSEDQTVHIYEEQESVSTRSDGKESKWLRKAQLLDSQKAVKDVKFAPRHDGLKLAAASAEGIVRIYTADDIFNLNIWTLQDTLKIYQIENGAGSDCDSSEHGLTCCSWNDSPFEPAKLALGGYAKRLSIWTCDSANKWSQECVLEESEFVIHDVAWAPSMGRTYHLIASANRTNIVAIHRVKRLSDGSVEPESCARLECPSAVWRVAWNATGTLLSTSGENGELSLWRKSMGGEWSIIQANIVNNVPVSSSYATPSK